MFRQVLIASFLLTVPAIAGDEPELTGRNFMMPSRNVACIKMDPENGLSDRLYCLRYEPKLIAVVLDKNGPVANETFGDQPAFEDTPILQYGENWFHEGFSCDSDPKGVVCSHSDYGAFRLSRQGMEVLR
jgi:hypothetical protein